MIPVISRLDPLHVNVKFGDGVPSDAQGPALLAFEKNLRFLTKQDVRVFKDRLGDDSRLRVMMTPKQRESL